MARVIPKYGISPLWIQLQHPLRNDTISQLSQDLVFLQKEFNEYIQLTNKKRDDDNTSFLDNILTLKNQPIHL